MSTNNWEKSWKNQLDKYDSPVDSKLFESITSKAAEKSGNTYLFGWLGLGFAVLSTAILIAGFKNNSVSNNAISGINAASYQATITFRQSGWDYLTNALHVAPLTHEFNNSGNFILSETPHDLAKDIHHSIQKSTNGSDKPAVEVTKAASNTKFSNIVNTPSAVHTEVQSVESIIASNPLTEKEDLLIDFEDANVRFGVAKPLSVLFPVNSGSNSTHQFNRMYQDNCFNDAKGRSSFYIDAYVGVGNSIRSLASVDNQSPYMNLRDSLEKSWYNSAAGARLGFILSSGMAIETGAEYQVHNEIFEYKNESEVRITYKYHYDQFGNVTRIDTITELGARTLRTHNKYQQITIPLRLGYTMEKGRWMIGARLGLGLHIWNHQQGVILDNTYQTYKIEEDPNEYFNKNWGMQYNASIQIGYRILPQTFLMIEPVWNSQSNGITQRPYTLEQKYQTLRVNVGIRFVPGSYY